MIDKNLLIESLKSKIKWNMEAYNKFKIPAHSHSYIALDHFLSDVESGKFDFIENKKTCKWRKEEISCGSSIDATYSKYSEIRPSCDKNMIFSSIHEFNFCPCCGNSIEEIKNA